MSQIKHLFARLADWWSDLQVQIQRTAKALNQCHRTGTCGLVSEACLADQVVGDGVVDDTQNLTHDHRPGREKKPQRVGGAQHPLPNRSLRKHCIRE